MSKRVITVNFTVKPSHMEEFTKLLKQMCADSLQEPGCLNYEASIDGNEVFLYEKYKSQKDIDFHNQTPHFKEFVKTIPDMLIDQTLSTYTAL